MASAADLDFLYQQLIDEFTHDGWTGVALITPTGTTWGITGTRGGATMGLKFTTPAPVDAETFYNTIRKAGYHEDLGLIAGRERQP